MLDGNKREFEIQNVTEWKEDNLGEGVTIVVLDDCDKPYSYMEHVVERPFAQSKETSHGTATASVIYQYVPNAKIIMFDVFGSSKRKQAVKWILEHQNEIDIINCSFTISKYSGKDFLSMLELDIPVFCASGNDGDWKDGVKFPASHINSIAIGAAYLYKENTNKEELRIGSYSNGGDDLDCVSFTNIDRYNSRMEETAFTHTSGASPSAASLYALYLSWRKKNNLPKLKVNEVKDFIKEHSIDVVEGTNRDGVGLFILPRKIPEIASIKKHNELISSLGTNEYIKEVGEYTVIRHDTGEIKVYNNQNQEVVV